MKTFLWILSIILIIIGLIVSFKFFYELSKEYTFKGSFTILLDKTGQVGDFIGGVVGTILSLSGFIILILTLSAQTRASYLEQFESKFFELVRLYRENVSEIKIKRKSKGEDKEFHDFEFVGRQAFRLILSDFVICRNELKPYFNMFQIDEIYQQSYLTEIKEKLNVDDTHIRLKSIARINIAYCIVFFGVSTTEGFQILEKLFRKRYKPQFYNSLLDYMRMKPIASSKFWVNWEKFREIKRFKDRLAMMLEVSQLRKKKTNQTLNQYYYDDQYIKFYGGHQHRLGHYFRHLFQAVNFVNAQKQLNEKEKYFYVKTLRAQLSTYEQALLFVNSLSIMGMPWELSPEYTKSKLDLINIFREKNARLITKYNLIKNLPGEHILGINYAHYYPNVKYESNS